MATEAHSCDSALETKFFAIVGQPRSQRRSSFCPLRPLRSAPTVQEVRRSCESCASNDLKILQSFSFLFSSCLSVLPRGCFRGGGE